MSQRDKTRAAIQEMTGELLVLYARRKMAERPPHVPDTQREQPPGRQQLERRCPGLLQQQPAVLLQ